MQMQYGEVQRNVTALHLFHLRTMFIFSSDETGAILTGTSTTSDAASVGGGGSANSSAGAGIAGGGTGGANVGVR